MWGGATLNEVLGYDVYAEALANGGEYPATLLSKLQDRGVITFTSGPVDRNSPQTYRKVSSILSQPDTLGIILQEHNAGEHPHVFGIRGNSKKHNGDVEQIDGRGKQRVQTINLFYALQRTPIQKRASPDEMWVVRKNEVRVKPKT